MSFAQVAHWRVKENDESLCRSPHDPPPPLAKPNWFQGWCHPLKEKKDEERHTSESQLWKKNVCRFNMFQWVEWRTNLLE